MTSPYGFSLLRGIIPPMITPLIEQNKLDIEGLYNLIEHILDAKVHGLFILGNPGEAPSLGKEVCYELIKLTCEAVNGRVPVLVGITDTSFWDSIYTARCAAEAGAAAVVLAPPYYYPAGQPEILGYLTHILPQIPLPVFLYNVPGHTKLSFDLDTVRRAANIPGIVGIKDCSADMLYFHQLQLLFENRSDFSLLVGPEGLLAETLLMGGHGGISGGANMFPKLFVDLYNAAVAKDLDTVLKLHRKITLIHSTLYKVGLHGSRSLKAIKCVLSCKGICSDLMAEPFHHFANKERMKIKAYLEQYDFDS